MPTPYVRLAAGRVGLLTLQRGDLAGPSLLCFPHAGGSARSFAALARALPREWAIHAVDPPGRLGTGGEPLTSVEQLVDTYLEALPATLWRSFLVGHSLGGYVALALAQRLVGRTRGLAILATTPPQLKSTSDSTVGLSDAQLVSWATRLGYDLSGQLPADALQLVLRALRADLSAHAQFRFEGAPRLGLPVLLCGGQADTLCPAASFARWRDVLSGRLRFTNGGHFFVQSHAAELAAELGDFVR
jgi:surfactin synthase thioesterase subunit